MDNPNDITRTVAIEHAGEKIRIEVHVHLSQEEIRKLAIRVEQDIARRIRSTGYIPEGDAPRSVQGNEWQLDPRFHTPGYAEKRLAELRAEKADEGNE